jgi:hypothetical protein
LLPEEQRLREEFKRLLAANMSPLAVTVELQAQAHYILLTFAACISSASPIWSGARRDAPASSSKDLAASSAALCYR